MTPESFPNELFESNSQSVFSPSIETLTLTQARQRGVEEVERNYLMRILAVHKGKIGETAEAAGISTRQLNKLMNKYGIKKETFKSL